MSKPKGYVFGRPTKFKSEYCDIVIELGKNGDSLAQMAAHFNVARSTIDKWAEDNECFSEALSIAKTHCQSWWEEAAQKGIYLGGSGFNAAVWKTTMQARFREDYTERQEIHQTGAISHNVSIGELTDEQLAAIAATGGSGVAK